MTDAERIARLERDLRQIVTAANALIEKMQELSRMKNDAECGRALKKAVQNQPLFVVPSAPKE